MFIFRIAENSAEIKQVKVVVWGQFRAAVIQKELSHPDGVKLSRSRLLGIRDGDSNSQTCYILREAPG
jgi:hypothetical protein